MEWEFKWNRKGDFRKVCEIDFDSNHVITDDNNKYDLDDGELRCSQLTQLKAENAKLREGLRNLKTFEMENVSYSYDDNYRMVDQEIPLEKDYCGDYVEVESIKALLEQTSQSPNKF